MSSQLAQLGHRLRERPLELALQEGEMVAGLAAAEAVSSALRELEKLNPAERSSVLRGIREWTTTDSEWATLEAIWGRPANCCRRAQ